MLLMILRGTLLSSACVAYLAREVTNKKQYMPKVTTRPHTQLSRFRRDKGVACAVKNEKKGFDKLKDSQQGLMMIAASST